MLLGGRQAAGLATKSREMDGDILQAPVFVKRSCHILTSCPHAGAFL
jgi:hypothetical protein